MAGYWDYCFYYKKKKKKFYHQAEKQIKNGLMILHESKQIYFSSKAYLGKTTMNETQ